MNHFDIWFLVEFIGGLLFIAVIMALFVLAWSVV